MLCYVNIHHICSSCLWLIHACSFSGGSLSVISIFPIISEESIYAFSVVLLKTSAGRFSDETGQNVRWPQHPSVAAAAEKDGQTDTKPIDGGVAIRYLLPVLWMTTSCLPVTAKMRDQLRNPTLGNRVRASVFTCPVKR